MASIPSITVIENEENISGERASGREALTVDFATLWPWSFDADCPKRGPRRTAYTGSCHSISFHDMYIKRTFWHVAEVENYEGVCVGGVRLDSNAVTAA